MVQGKFVSHSVSECLAGSDADRDSAMPGVAPDNLSAPAALQPDRESALQPSLRLDADEASAMEHQRRLGLHIAAFHFADEDDMVAFRVPAAVMAFEPGGDPFE